MQKKDKVRGFVGMAIFGAVVFCFAISSSLKARKVLFSGSRADTLTVNVVVKAFVSHDDVFEVFFHHGTSFSPENSVRLVVKKSDTLQTLTFPIPKRVGFLRRIRLDAGERLNCITLHSIALTTSESTSVLDSKFFIHNRHVRSLIDSDEGIVIVPDGRDPFIEYDGDVSVILMEMARPAKIWFYLFSVVIAIVSLFILSMLDLDPANPLNAIRLAFCLVLGLLVFETSYLIFEGIKYKSLREVILGMDSVKVALSIKADHEDTIQIYYTSESGQSFSEAMSVKKPFYRHEALQKVQVCLPISQIPKQLRIDPGSRAGTTVRIASLSIGNSHTVYDWNAADIIKNFHSMMHISHFVLEDGFAVIHIFGSDPSFGCRGVLPDEPIRRSGFPLIFALICASLVFFSALSKNYSFSKTPSYQFVVTCAFIAVISIAIIGSISPSIDRTKSNENRTLKEEPEFTIPEVFTYSSHFSDYVKEQFTFRNLLFSLNSSFKVNFLGVSPLPEKVVVGENNWLFLSDDNVIKDYMGIDSLSLDQLEKIKQKLKHKFSWFNENGIKYYLAIFPEKSQIYPEYLPSGIKNIYQTSKLDQLLDYLGNDSSIVIIDVRNRLLAEKVTHQIYFKTDTHWNELGAFAAYQEIVKRISNDFPLVQPKSLGDYVQTSIQGQGGDLSKLLAIESRDHYPVLVPNFQSPSNILEYKYPFPGIDVVAKQSSDAGRPKLMMFRDSFTTSLIPFLSENFSESIFVWTPNHDFEVIKEERPDVVIHALVERYIEVLQY